MTAKPVSQRERTFLLIFFTLLFLFQEGLCRWIFPLPEVSNFNRIDYSPLADALRKSAPQQMNSSYIWDSTPDGASSTQTLNLYGFRSSENWKMEKPAGVQRIAVFGDSFVEGLLADQMETLPVGFANESRKKGRSVEVMNMGLSGTGLSDQIPLIRDTALLFHPDQIILVITAGDLPPPAISPDWPNQGIAVEKNPIWMPRLFLVLKRVFTHQAVPRRWHSKPYHYFQPVPHPGNPLTEKTAKDAAFVDPAVLEAMKSGQLNPYLIDYISSAQSSLLQPIAAEAHLGSLADFLKQKEIHLSVVYFPHSLQVSDSYLTAMRKYSHAQDKVSLTELKYQSHAQQLSQLCEKLNIPFLDLTPALRAEEAQGRKMYWDYDGHPRGAAYLLAGKLAAQLVQRQ